VVQIFNKWKHVANFLSVYIEEAHPVDEWHVYVEICFKQPKTVAERISIARKYVEETGCPMQIVADSISNQCEGFFFCLAREDVRRSARKSGIQRRERP